MQMQPQSPQLAIVLPTFNEAANIELMVERLSKALAGIVWEAIFVDDDSKDGTAQAVAQAARRHANVRIVRRIGRRGLSTAVVEGALSSMAPMIAVMDSDLQHDEKLLPEMLRVLKAGMHDVVVGTRYAEGGGVGEWSRSRQAISRAATRLAQLVTRVQLSDPMSGFFMMTRSAFEGAVRQLSGQGFKILLDILASSRTQLRVYEMPYTFRTRQHGESKLDTLVAVEYLTLLVDKTVGRFVPVRFLMFAFVGALGLLVHMSVLALAFKAMRVEFEISQGIAATVAMTFNFFVNNFLTYRDQRLRGVRGLALGLLSFYAVCSLGAVSNLGIAGLLFTNHYAWWVAAAAGVVMGSVWNYAATSVFTWKPANTGAAEPAKAGWLQRARTQCSAWWDAMTGRDDKLRSAP